MFHHNGLELLNGLPSYGDSSLKIVGKCCDFLI